MANYDFTYNNKAIVLNGPLRTNGRNQPLNAKYRVKNYSDIEDIPTPAVGEFVYVLEDETRDDKPSLYIIKSLASNDFGVPNTIISEVSLLQEFLESMNSDTVDDKHIWCGTEEEYNILTNNGADESADTIYMIQDEYIAMGPTGPRGPQGLSGIAGPTGPQGANLAIKGLYKTESELNSAHPSGNLLGDTYLVNNNEMCIWDGIKFNNVGVVSVANKATSVSINGDIYRPVNDVVTLPTNCESGILILDKNGKILNDMLPDEFDLVLASPNGNKFKIIVDNLGQLKTQKI